MTLFIRLSPTNAGDLSSPISSGLEMIAALLESLVSSFSTIPSDFLINMIVLFQTTGILHDSLVLTYRFVCMGYLFVLSLSMRDKNLLTIHNFQPLRNLDL